MSDPVFPREIAAGGADQRVVLGADKTWLAGLTKRELFSTFAMHALIPMGSNYGTKRDLAVDAIHYADALIAMLEKKS